MSLTNPLTFWSQSLENRGADLFVRWESGKWTELADEADQAAAENAISSVRLDGIELKNNQRVRADLHIRGLTGEPAFFIMDLKTVERDSAGRAAFFICHGKVEDHEDWMADVRDAILSFAQEYGLALDITPDTLLFELKHVQHKKKNPPPELGHARSRSGGAGPPGVLGAVVDRARRLKRTLVGRDPYTGQPVSKVENPDDTGENIE